MEVKTPKKNTLKREALHFADQSVGWPSEGSTKLDLEMENFR